MTALDILNQALAELVQPEVTTFDPEGNDPNLRPETDSGMALARIYERVVSKVQRSFPWQELTTSLKFANPVTQTQDGWYRFQLGSLGILRPLECYSAFGSAEDHPNTMEVVAGEDGSITLEPVRKVKPTTLTKLILPAQDEPMEYRIEQNTLLAPTEQVLMRAIVQDNNPDNWSSELADCVICKLAADGALAAGRDAQLAQMLASKYSTEVFPQAKRLQSRYKQGVKYMPWGGKHPLRGRVRG